MEQIIIEDFGKLADDSRIQKTVNALKKNGFEAMVVNDGEEARKMAENLIADGSEVFTMASVTLDSIGLVQAINESGKYVSVRKKLNSMNPENDMLQMQRIGAAPEWAVGSVQAITEEGTIVAASATGSQLPAYAYGAQHVLWIVGAQKLTKDIKEAMERIYEYVYPLEDNRALKAYGVHSGVNKVLILNREKQQGRATVIIVKEKLGF
jgi:hypothetical protein